MSSDQYSLLRTFGGISLEYADIGEVAFAGVAGAAYSPPERGDFRRIAGSREIQLLSECPGVVETFQTSAATIYLPANTVPYATNDAGDGRLFFLKNSGTGIITIREYLGTALYSLPAGQVILVLGNTANTWDFLTGSLTTRQDGSNVQTNTQILDFLGAVITAVAGGIAQVDYGFRRATVNTTDATVTTLLTIPTTTDTQYYIRMLVIARRTGGSAGAEGDGAIYERSGRFKNVSGTVTNPGGLTTVDVSEDQLGWTATLDISGTSIRVRVTGAANNNVTWYTKTWIEQV